VSPHPAGPLVDTPDRRRVLGVVADEIAALPQVRVRRVGVDGVDGAGKTVFADELADHLRRRGVSVIRASIDGFHRPRTERYSRGRTSAEGYYLDSFDYDAVHRDLLDPLGQGGSGRYLVACFDHTTDRPVAPRWRRARVDEVLVFDGIFLHRLELRPVWDYSIFLDVTPRTSVHRCAGRDGTPDDLDDPSLRRYLEGQARYLRECDPAGRATRLIDHDDLGQPRLIR